MLSNSDEKKLYQRLKTLSDVFLLPTSKPLDYKSIIRTVTKHFKIFTDADASVLMLNNNEDLIPVCSMGIPFSKIKEVSLPSSTRLKDIIVHPVLDVRYSSFMNTPLIHNRKLVGVSAVFSTVPEKFHIFEHGKYENLFLTMLASYAAVGIDNVILLNTIKAMEHAEFAWEETFDAINDLISIHDADFNIVRANMAVARKFNKDVRKIVGKKCYKIFHGTDEPWKTCPHRRSMETMVACTEEVKDPHMGGVFCITSFPRFDEAGMCIGSINVSRDLTNRKKTSDLVGENNKH
ncbi:MAG: PAS domain-containing protein [Planctomycetota bacterium]|nr:PAS domain-containing protein [Planctomycetota bacterium]